MNKFNAPLVKPNINKQISSDNEVPSFDFKHNKVNNFSVDDLDNENRIALLNTLYKYKDITWTQIKTSGRHGAGTEKIDISSLSFVLPTSITADVNYLLAMRYHGNAPILGFRVGSIFHIVAIDHKFEAYEH